MVWMLILMFGSFPVSAGHFATEQSCVAAAEAAITHDTPATQWRRRNPVRFACVEVTR